MHHVFEIPFTPKAQQITANLSGVDYKLSIRYSNYNYWIMDITDIDDVPVLSGIPIVTGTDLLGQFAYLDLAKEAVIVALTLVGGRPSDAIPTYKNLGIDSHVYYVTP